MITSNKVKVQVGSRLKIKHDVVPNSIINKNNDEFDPLVGNSAAASSMTLYSLCDKDYMKNKKRKSHLSHIDTKNVKQKHKDEERPILHNPIMKSDSGLQVEIVDGKIVLKESSLVISGDVSVPAYSTYEEVEEDMHSASRYSSYRDKQKTVSWGLEETRLFYDALRQCGTEFSLMQTFLPNRTRKELKNKFIREENLHPELVERSINSVIPLEMTPFDILLGENNA